jgi:flagellar biosynthesis protein FlhG
MVGWGNKQVISVGGGKGGVGKSCFSANLGVRLAQKGQRVILVDADLGGANLHTMVGVRYPDRTLEDYTSGRRPTIQSTLIDTPIPHLQLLSSASDLLAITAPNFRERQKLLRGINQVDTDVVIFDIAAGSHSRAIDFFALAPIGLIIIEPLPTSLENAFTFLKNLLLRILLRLFYQDIQTRNFIQTVSDPRNESKYLQFHELLQRLESEAPQKIQKFRDLFAPEKIQLFAVVNSLKSPAQSPVGENFVKIIKRYLALNLKVLTTLPYEPAMDDAISSRTPFVVRHPDSNYTHGIDGAIETLAKMGLLHNSQPT